MASRDDTGVGDHQRTVDAKFAGQLAQRIQFARAKHNPRRAVKIECLQHQFGSTGGGRNSF